jgi:hypothetical protein
VTWEPEPAAPFPPLTADERLWFATWLDEQPSRIKRKHSPLVIATGHIDERDERVFARFSALYLLDDVPWLVRALLAWDVSDAPVVRRLALEPWDQDGPEVSSEVTHRLRVALLRDRALEQLRREPEMLQIAERFGMKVTTRDRRNAADLAAKATSKTGRKRGRPPLFGPEHFAEIARECIALYREGRRGIRATLAKERKVSEATVRDWVKRARELGYLTESKHGKADYRPGPNLDPTEPKGE